MMTKSFSIASTTTFSVNNKKHNDSSIKMNHYAFLSDAIISPIYPKLQLARMPMTWVRQ